MILFPLCRQAVSAARAEMGWRNVSLSAAGPGRDVLMTGGGEDRDIRGQY